MRDLSVCNIWTGDLAEMESLSSRNKNVEYFLCVINIFTKYAWVKPLNDKKCEIFLSTFTKLVNESNHKQKSL